MPAHMHGPFWEPLLLSQGALEAQVHDVALQFYGLVAGLTPINVGNCRSRRVLYKAVLCAAFASVDCHQMAVGLPPCKASATWRLAIERTHSNANVSHVPGW